MGIMPKVSVFQKKNNVKSSPGLASKVAVVGAFEKLSGYSPVLCSTLDEAYEKLGTDTSYEGVASLEKLFYGASSLLAVSITTSTGTGDNITINKELTNAKLTSALSAIAKEDFDLLFICGQLDEISIPIVTSFLNSRFENKLPAGYVAFYPLFAPESAGDFCYGLIAQELTVKDTQLSRLESGAYYCGLLASLNVGTSMTMKEVPDVTSITPEFTFENGDIGLEFVTRGMTILRCLDRANGKYIVVNSEQPNGLDLYINRTRDFVVKEFALHDFLGDRNRDATLNEIKQEVDRVKERCVNTLDLLKDIEYTVEKKSAKCVDINITKLLFDDIITQINVYITVEVE